MESIRVLSGDREDVGDDDEWEEEEEEDPDVGVRTVMGRGRAMGLVIRGEGA